MNNHCESPRAIRRIFSWKKWAKRFGCFIVVILVIFLLGPRVHVDPSIRPVDSRLLQDIDTYFASEESRYSLVPGTEKAVEWRYEDHRKTGLAVVYIHGFSASRQECMPVPSDLANRLNANLFATRLTAHGCGSEAFATVTVNDWLNDVHEAVAIRKRLGDRVVLVGMSTGATLALWMANRDPEILAVVLLSPNFGIPDKNVAYALYLWGQQIIKTIVGRYSGFTPKNELHERFWTTRYRTEVANPSCLAVSVISLGVSGFLLALLTLRMKRLGEQHTS